MDQNEQNLQQEAVQITQTKKRKLNPLEQLGIALIVGVALILFTVFVTNQGDKEKEQAIINTAGQVMEDLIRQSENETGLAKFEVTGRTMYGPESGYQIDGMPAMSLELVYDVNLNILGVVNSGQLGLDITVTEDGEYYVINETWADIPGFDDY